MYWSPFSSQTNNSLMALELIQDIYTNNDSWGQEILVINDDNMHNLIDITAEEMTKIIFPHNGKINKKILSELMSSLDHSNAILIAELINSCDVLNNIDLLYDVFTNTSYDKNTFLIDYEHLIIELYNIIHSF